jgi:hypothetical protein
MKKSRVCARSKFYLSSLRRRCLFTFFMYFYQTRHTIILATGNFIDLPHFALNINSQKGTLKFHKSIKFESKLTIRGLFHESPKKSFGNGDKSAFLKKRT